MTASFLTRLSQKYDQCSKRERIVLLICAIAIIGLVFNLLVFRPFAEQQRVAGKQLGLLQTELETLKTNEKVILVRKDVDVDQENKLRLSALDAEADRLRQQLKENVVNLVSPREMPELLKNLLTQQQLRLISLENLPPEQLDFGKQGGADALAPALYRHRLKMEFSGDYLALLKYLRHLENLPRAMVWEKVEIESDEYPAATVRLQVYTLSLAEGWIGG